VLGPDNQPASARLAIAVNGVVRALAQTSTGAPGARDGDWTALLPPGSLRAGRNLVQVYALAPDGRRLELGFSSGERPESLNLSSSAATQFWGVTASGFVDRERRSTSAWWTTGEGTLAIPFDVEPKPRSIRIGLWGPPAAGGPVRIRLEGCVLHDGPIDSSPWYRTFPLDRCPTLDSAHEVHLVISSSTTRAADGSERGVAVEIVNFLSSPWPLPPAADQDSKGSASIMGSRVAVARAAPVRVDVRNTGAVAWSDASNGAPDASSVALSLRWRRLPDGVVDESQQLRLPYVVYPGEVIHLDVPLVPPPSVDGAGPWDVRLILHRIGGGELPGGGAAPTLRVTTSRAR
jgi:hypothetical protein